MTTLNAIKARKHLEELQIDYFLVTNLVNIQYMTGLQSTNALLLISPEAMYVFTDPRYEIESQQISGYNFEIGRDLLGMAMNHLIPGRKLYADESLSYLQFKILNEKLPGVQVETRSKLIETVRLVKSEQELQYISKACSITSNVWEAIIKEPFIGKSEIQIARRIQSLILDFGGDGLAFESIVAAGANSASPHHTPTDYVIQAGDFIKCDFGAKFRNYHSDMTRMAVAGRVNSWQQEIFDIVSEAQSAAVAAIQPGITSDAIDSAAISIIQKAGYADAFTHPTGHGIGLEIHEIPIHGSQDTTLCPAMTLTVEPGIYLEGKGGVRLEDTLVVLEEGSQNLTTASKALAQVE